MEESSRTAGAIAEALRHAGVRAPVEVIRVQREPFDAAGVRAEPFAKGTRFAKERLCHAEIAFGVGVKGPLVIGDGRFLGLGIMAPPLDATRGVYAFNIVNGLQDSPRASDVTCALRRAVMARVQRVLGPRRLLDAYFSGHRDDGAPARRKDGGHLAFAFHAPSKRLLVIAPHMLERREAFGRELEHLRDLDAGLDGLRHLLAGPAGRLDVRPALADMEHDPLFGLSHEWVSVTPYVVTRHAKKISAADALALDLRVECRRIGLPDPYIETVDVRGIGGLGLVGHARMRFRVATAGPIILGRDRHSGGGLFQRARTEHDPRRITNA